MLDADVATTIRPVPDHARGDDGASPARPDLSPRMVACLQWASEGKSSVDIGQLLDISARTVDDYLTESRRRLGVRTRVQAVLRAMMLGLIVPPGGAVGERSRP